MKKTIKYLFIMLFVFMLFGCSDRNLNNENTDNNTTINDETVVEPVIDNADIKRPFAVMINDIHVARQVQSGLSKAYLVYELIEEGGITRYLAFFDQDVNLDYIGSIRSARPYYLDYVMEHDAIFAHWGGSDQAKEDIKTLKINDIELNNMEGKYSFRYNPLNLAWEHRGFSSTELLKKAVSDKKYRTTTENTGVFEYTSETVDLSNRDAKSATNINIKYSNSANPVYKYDSVNKVYKKYHGDSAQKDYQTGEQLTYKNVIAYAVTNKSIDSSDHQELSNIGEGIGYYFTEGKAVKIYWKKPSRSSKTTYTYTDGTPLVLNEGHTFVNIYPTKGSLKFS